MYEARFLKSGAVLGYPKAVSPISGRTVTLIAYQATAIHDAVSFQWQFKPAVGGDYAAIPGAIRWKCEIENYSAANAGMYKCIVEFSDNTTSVTDGLTLGAPKAETAGTPENKYHSAPKIYNGPWYRTHVHWKDIEKLNMLVANPTLDTVEKFQNEMAKDPGLMYIYDLINRYGYVLMVDSRDGYTYAITELTTYNRAACLVKNGQFVNFWEAP